jgi:2-dehydro-3-deoxyphosphogluconate aldolase/(4S)-4-hydroxy-2-oxoglutarate aldolase
MTLDQILTLSPVIPVLVIEDRDHAVPLARALVAGGLPVLEVTFRTSVAAACIEAIIAEVQGAVVGAGTVIDSPMRQAAADLGCRFAVSPGLIPGERSDGPVPLLPGVATASELIAGLQAGFSLFKLFPANIAGGPGVLRAYASPFPQARFCPTGGVSAVNAAEYLSLPNVLCVGGSWVAPPDAIRAGDWGRITRLAREAAALAPRPPAPVKG